MDAITLNDEQAVLAAEAQYNTLTQSQKTLVTNYVNIEPLKTKIAQLKQLDIDTAAAQQVITKIASLSQNITLSDKDAVVAARATYDALTPAQKLLVNNYSILISDESVIQNLMNNSSSQTSSQSNSNSASQSATNSASQTATNSEVSSAQPEKVPNTGDNTCIPQLFALLVGLAVIVFKIRVRKAV